MLMAMWICVSPEAPLCWAQDAPGLLERRHPPFSRGWGYSQASRGLCASIINQGVRVYLRACGRWENEVVMSLSQHSEHLGDP